MYIYIHIYIYVFAFLSVGVEGRLNHHGRFRERCLEAGIDVLSPITRAEARGRRQTVAACCSFLLVCGIVNKDNTSRMHVSANICMYRCNYVYMYIFFVHIDMYVYVCIHMRLRIHTCVCLNPFIHPSIF